MRHPLSDRMPRKAKETETEKRKRWLNVILSFNQGSPCSAFSQSSWQYTRAHARTLTHLQVSLCPSTLACQSECSGNGPHRFKTEHFSRREIKKNFGRRIKACSAMWTDKCIGNMWLAAR